MNIPVLASLVHVVTGVCLEGGIPPHERKNLASLVSSRETLRRFAIGCRSRRVVHTGQDFTEQRVNASNPIVCKACASGTFSKALSDSIGETYICAPCAKGTSQDMGAATYCKPCKSGEYQDEIGSRTCKRCDIASYQEKM
eukprot:g2237.t1